MKRIVRALFEFRFRDAGSATVEFVIVFPMVMAILLTSIDFGAFMLRQVFLDRGVNIAVREVLLGNIPSSGQSAFREVVCSQVVLIADCTTSISIEMRPINTNTWQGIYDPAQCVDRSANITPTLTFNPSNGNQDLMLVRVCASVDPFITITGMIFGLEQGTDGDYLILASTAFTNEPSD